MPQTSKTFRVFVSSTFSDLKAERNALQREVFPRLSKLCLGHGCRFQAIDLRWGINEEAALDQQTLNICLDEIRRCQRTTPRPNFIILLGDRYGWIPLPANIEAREFEQILSKVPPEQKGKLLRMEDQPADSKGWYRRDDNAVPAEYCLRPRTLTEEKDPAGWAKIEAELRAILLKAIDELRWPKDHPEWAKYETSATHQEIEEGALKAVNADQHVFCFSRVINGIPELDALKNELKDKLKDNYYEYDARQLGEDGLPGDVYQTLSKIILEEIGQLEQIETLEKEIQDHQAFANERAKFFIGRAEALDEIGNYLSAPNARTFAMYGEGGTGKSALAAYALWQAEQNHPGAAVISRFIGATPGSADGRTLLESLCRQITRTYGGDESAIPSTYEELINEFAKSLELATADKPLILFIDSLDQLSDANNARSLVWLPGEMHENVSLIVTTRPGECLDSLKNKLGEGSLVELQPMPKDEGDELLELWLQAANRTLQAGQKNEVLNKFAITGRPLHLKLAFEEARRWRSFETDCDISPDIKGAIGELYDRLEIAHGKIMAAGALGYLAASRDKNGFSEDEMLDILSGDKAVFDAFVHGSKHDLSEPRLPVVVWSRLYLDIEPYLTERTAEGATLLSFYHRELGEVAESRYLGSDEIALSRHKQLASYFQHLADPAEDATWTGIPRALAELPYHQTMAAMWDQLFDLMTNFNFLENKAAKVDISVYKDAAGNDVKIYNGVTALQQDFDLALEHFPVE